LAGTRIGGKVLAGQTYLVEKGKRLKKLKKNRQGKKGHG